MVVWRYIKIIKVLELDKMISVEVEGRIFFEIRILKLQCIYFPNSIESSINSSMLNTKWWNLEFENPVWKYWIVSATDEKFVSHLLRHRLYGVKRGMNNFSLLYRTYFSTYRPGLTNGHSAWISDYLSLWKWSTFELFVGGENCWKCALNWMTKFGGPFLRKWKIWNTYT